MRIWLANSTEPTPVTPGEFRLRRMGMLAEYLVQRGHHVTWWTTTFDHFRKTELEPRTKEFRLNDSYSLRLLHSPPYQKNVSLARVRNHQVLAREFLRHAAQETAPDLILASLPPLELAEASIQFGIKIGVPTVLDIRDLWPDLFLDLLPAWCRPIGKLPLRPYFRLARSACSHADVVTSNSEPFLEWGLANGNRIRTDADQVFPFGYRPPPVNQRQIEEANQFWDNLGIGVDDATHVLCFFGSINHQFDFDSVIEAVTELQGKVKLQLVVCGAGESLAVYRQKTRRLPHVFFPGWIGAEKIWTLMERASLGVAPYIDTENFRKNIANKPIEYLAGGLPIVSSLDEGVLAQLLRDHDCGATYGGDSQRLQAILTNWCQPGDELRRRAARARKLYEAKFSADVVYSRMADHLEAIAQNQRSRYDSRRAA